MKIIKRNSWKKRLNDDPVEWLLESNPWTKHKTLTDLLELPHDSDEVTKAKKELINHEKIKSLISETAQWFPVSYARHNNPAISHYKLRMLSDFGLTVEDDNIMAIALKVVEHSEDGFLAFRQKLPGKHTGFIKSDPTSDEWHALPCDSPLLTHSLLSIGFKAPEVIRSAELIKQKWSSSVGWFCHLYFVNNMFKRLQVGCPLAGLMALELFSAIPELKKSEYARNAYEPIKYHRESGRSLYYFGRSKKFWKMKYPFVWYNALYMADVLTRFKILKKEALVKELIKWIQDSQDEQGRFKPTSMFRSYKEWDFANKHEPSPWITFLCCRILKNYYSR